ncbi:hypothetical protein FIBSPDRAFT_525959 [Athelia psychrophila]|uniref:Uncharacterized protein n=1 Tax=Athelia psychrophila TaxID=1759441 RepID=A0A166JJF4_9AGAM|nr:hypothetical protein FIBSPDRAFT_525959 [Fibularhizoctonia sp. CBS 109695]
MPLALWLEKRTMLRAPPLEMQSHPRKGILSLTPFVVVVVAEKRSIYVSNCTFNVWFIYGSYETKLFFDVFIQKQHQGDRVEKPRALEQDECHIQITPSKTRGTTM